MSKVLQANLEAALASSGTYNSDEDDAAMIQTMTSSSNKNKQKQKLQGKEGSEDGLLSNVIYIGHLPVGFEEQEIRGFFHQFGHVENVRLSRSKRSGNPKGYGFVQFTSSHVAKIASDAMSGYFLLEKRLVCHVIPKDNIHPNLFPKKPFRVVKYREINQIAVNRKRTSVEWADKTKRQVSREQKKMDKLKALGIDYDFPTCVDVGADDASNQKLMKKRKVSVSEDDATKNAVDMSKSKKDVDVSVSAKKKTKSSRKSVSSKLNTEASTSTPSKSISNERNETLSKKEMKKTPKKTPSKSITPVPDSSSKRKTRSSRKSVSKI